MMKEFAKRGFGFLIVVAISLAANYVVDWYFFPMFHDRPFPGTPYINAAIGMIDLKGILNNLISSVIAFYFGMWWRDRSIKKATPEG